MEEPRLPPSASAIDGHHDDDDKPDDPPAVWHRPTSSLPDLPSLKSNDQSSGGHFRKYSLNFSPSTIPLRPPAPPPLEPTPEVETYVVQVPRDQIYWVPPPEHARIVEQHRINPIKKEKPVCSKRLMFFFLVLIILGILAGAVALIVHSIYNPLPAKFTVEKVAVKSSTSSPRHNKTFEITLKARNPTSRVGIKYVHDPNDNVSLTYEHKLLGYGKLPEFSHDANGSGTVHLKMKQYKGTELPASKKHPVKLVLKMDTRAKFRSGLAEKKKIVKVACSIMVEGLETKTVRIVTQDCQSEFKT